MSYLASTNSIFGARSSQIRLPTPVQYCYMQTADIVPSSTNNFFLTKKASFTLDSASTNVVDDLFTAEGNSATSAGNVAIMKVPITGIWSFSWTIRYLNSSGENSCWFSVQNSKFYNDTTGNRRLSYNGTGSYNCNATLTGYWDAGDTLGLNAFSAVSNNTLKALYGSCLIVTLIQPTAPRITATPIIPPVIVS